MYMYNVHCHHYVLSCIFNDVFCCTIPPFQLFPVSCTVTPLCGHTSVFVAALRTPTNYIIITVNYSSKSCVTDSIVSGPVCVVVSRLLLSLVHCC